MGGVAPDWLSQLAPAHAPPPPGWWPLAAGWWGVMVLGAIALVLVAYWQTRGSVRLRRKALRELEAIEVRWSTTGSSDATLAEALEHLLRRYAVARFGRDAVAGLSGERWISFVIAHGGTAWSAATGADLLRAAYGGGNTTNADRALWLLGARAFIKERKK